MHSRTITLAAAFALMFLIVTGSLALHHTLGHAASRAPEPVVPAPAAVLAATPGAGAADANPATADTLQWLLTRIHVLFEPYSAEINDAMIPYLADVLTVVNQHADLQYRLALCEPDADLARERAQTLNEVLRLNVVAPASLRIVGQEGSHGIRVDITS